MRYRPALLLLAVLPELGTAQRQQPAARGAASITIADVQRRIGIIADDSMLGRATPSPQLDAVAAYVAGEFKRFGLKPGGDSGTYFSTIPSRSGGSNPKARPSGSPAGRPLFGAGARTCCSWTGSRRQRRRRARPW